MSENKESIRLQRTAIKLQVITIILQTLVIIIGVGSIWYATTQVGVATNILNNSNEALKTAKDSLEFATRPAFLIVEIESEKDGSYFDDNSNIYRFAGSPTEATNVIRTNIWNSGAQVAENVTFSIEFYPQNPENVSVHDFNSIIKCRGDVCLKSGSPATIRAIEPSGFYTLVSSFTIYPDKIEELKEPLHLKIMIKNPQTGQEIIRDYKVE